MQYREAAVVARESILMAEAEWLSSIKAELVVTLSSLYCCSVIRHSVSVQLIDVGVVCVGNV